MSIIMVKLVIYIPTNQFHFHGEDKKQKTVSTLKDGHVCKYLHTPSSLIVASLSASGSFTKGEDYRAGDESGFDSEALIITYTATSS